MVSTDASTTRWSGRLPGLSPTSQPSHDHDDPLFHFYIQHANPELWCTTLPLIVQERCAGHKGLIATWLAIHWLIVLWGSTSRRAFGVREIAERADVGRNELTGPRGYIQRLVDLDLLQIVGYQPIPGLPNPRPIYAIDLWALELASLQLVPEILRGHGLPPPPRPAPDPRQTSFLELLDAGEEAQPVPAPAWPVSPPAPAPPGTGTGTFHAPAPVPVALPAATSQRTACPEIVPALACQAPSCPDSGTVLSRQDTSCPETVPVAPETVPAMHENGTDVPQTVPALSRFRDVEGERERTRERESTAAPADYESLIPAITRAVLQEILQLPQLQLQPQLAPESPSPVGPPQAPAGEPAYSASILDLWRADRPQVLQRDSYQLELLANSFDVPTGGHGAYWLGRAIMLADLCLRGKGQYPTIPYVRAILRRWQAEGSWGSDLDLETDLASPAGKPAPAPPAPAAAAPPAADLDHPAIQRYRAAMGETPNAVQARQIAETVGDLERWQQVLDEWLANGWKGTSVAKMLDRYKKLGESLNPEPVSNMDIYMHPHLSDEERDRWIRRYHNTPREERRALLERFAREHPL